LESLRLATELSDFELTRTLLSLTNFPKMKIQLLLTNANLGNGFKNFTNSTLFWCNQDFCVMRNDKPQPRGKMNLIGRLLLNQESGVEEEHEEILQLRRLRIQEAIVKIMKTRKQLNQTQLQMELQDVLKAMFFPSRRLMKEQIEWLIENSYLKRAPDDINTFVYVA